MNAIVSPCGQYRYFLSRGAEPFCAFVLLNPSTADAKQDDPTTRRLAGFAKRWGFNGYMLVNIGAGRATQPKDWLAMEDPFGPDNEHYLRVASAYDTLVVGWGTPAPEAAVRRALPAMTYRRTAPLLCLGHNADGSPKRPLYLRADSPLVPWKGLK